MPTTPAERAAAAAASHSMTMQPKLLGLTNSLKGGTQQRHFQQQQDEYVYRAVSPHGHVYWEIDPNYVLLNQQQQQHAQQQQPLLLEEHLLQQQHYLQQQQQLAAAESSG